MNFYRKENLNVIRAKNKEAIESIVHYFFKTMKGMKALEYRI
jgi:hypothetical protein